MVLGILVGELLEKLHHSRGLSGGNNSMAQKEETRETKEKSGPSPVRNTNQFAETQNSRTTNAFNDTVRINAH